MSPGDSQYLTFHEFSSDGEIYFQEIGDMLNIKDMDLDGNQANYTHPYWDNTDTMFECYNTCLLYTSPSPRDRQKSRMPSSA